jgi:hypothetical protein
MKRHPTTSDNPIRLTAHPPERGKRSAAVTLASGCCSCCCCCCLHTLGSVLGAIYGSTVPIKDQRRNNFPTLPPMAPPRQTDTPRAAEGIFAPGNEAMPPVDTSFTAPAPGDFAAAPERTSWTVEPSISLPSRRDELEQKTPTLPAANLYLLVVFFLILVATLYVFVQQTGPSLDEPSYLIGDAVFIALFCLPAIQLVASLLSLIIVAIFYREKYISLVRIGKITLWSFVGAMVGTLTMAGACGLMYLGKK